VRDSQGTSTPFRASDREKNKKSGQSDQLIEEIAIAPSAGEFGVLKSVFLSEVALQSFEA